MTQLRFASEVGSARTVEHLLASKWNPGLNCEDTEAFEDFHNALSTPSVEAFDALMRFKETTPFKTLTTAQLVSLLSQAENRGWEEMAAHLRGLGAPKKS